jgi:hypothetical protein
MSGNICSAPVFRLLGATAAAAYKEAEGLNNNRLFHWNLFSFWFVVISIPASGGIEDEKISSPKWSNHSQPLRG